jgi:hypothetical protein
MRHGHVLRWKAQRGATTDMDKASFLHLLKLLVTRGTRVLCGCVFTVQCCRTARAPEPPHLATLRPLLLPHLPPPLLLLLLLQLLLLLLARCSTRLAVRRSRSCRRNCCGRLHSLGCLGCRHKALVVEPNLPRYIPANA